MKTTFAEVSSTFVDIDEKVFVCFITIKFKLDQIDTDLKKLTPHITLNLTKQ